MIIKVAMFAAARDLVDNAVVELELDNPSTVEELKKALLSSFPQLEPLMLRSAFSVNLEYAMNETSLDERSEIAMIPPVSGG